MSAAVIRRDGIYRFRGEVVRVISVDSDPRASVWVVFVEPGAGGHDRDAMVSRSELEVIA